VPLAEWLRRADAHRRNEAAVASAAATP